MVKVHLSSLGRYGSTAFLWPMYGISETSQAFCRLAAIFGATYMLRCRPQKFLLQPAEDGHRVISQVVIAENNQALDCRFVVSNLDLIPTTPRQDIHISRALLLVDRQFHPDTIIDFTVIPPGRFGNAHPIHVTHSDSNAGSAPEGKRRTPLPNFLSCSSSSFSSS